MESKSRKFKVEKINDATKITLKGSRNSYEDIRVLIVSDVHLDNKKCDKSLLKKHLDEAKRIGAPIIDNGDFFDCMGGKYDKRSHKGDIIPELQVPDYFDALIKYGAKFLEPYKDNLVVMAEGNHEISVNERHERNLTRLLIEKLDREDQIVYQKYAGWIVFSIDCGGRMIFNTTMFRTHGTGGNAPVTKGTIQSARRQDTILADLYISGHIHTEFTMPRPQWYLTADCNVKIRTPLHQQIGTYKDSTTGTWEQMKGFAPPSLGGVWLVFKWDRKEQKYKAKFETCE